MSFAVTKQYIRLASSRSLVSCLIWCIKTSNAAFVNVTDFIVFPCKSGADRIRRDAASPLVFRMGSRRCQLASAVELLLPLELLLLLPGIREHRTG